MLGNVLSFAYIIIRWILSLLFYRLDNWDLTCPIAHFYLFVLVSPSGLRDLNSCIRFSAVRAQSANHWTAKELPIAKLKRQSDSKAFNIFFFNI